MFCTGRLKQFGYDKVLI